MTTATATKTALPAIASKANGKAHGPNKSESLAMCNKTLATAITALKSTFQAFSKLEPVLSAACIAALNHGMAYRDARPANRIVQSVMDIGSATNRVNQARMLRAEIVAWFVANSPIYWDANGDVHVRKDGEKGYKPFNPEEAAATSFYERPAAKRAREEANRAQENALAPITPKVFMARVNGLKTWFERAQAEKDPTTGKARVIYKADKIAHAIKAVLSAADEAFTANDLKAGTDEKEVRSNVKKLKSSLLKKGSRKHRVATAKARKATPASTATASPAA